MRFSNSFATIIMVPFNGVHHLQSHYFDIYEILGIHDEFEHCSTSNINKGIAENQITRITYTQ